MAVAVVQSGYANAGTKTITSATAGNLIVVFISQSATTSAPTITDSASGTYTILPTSTLYSSSVNSLFVGYKFAVGGETSVSFTPGGAGSTVAICYFEVSGANNPLIVEAIKNTNNSAFVATISTGAITTNQNNLVLAAVALTGSQVPSAWTGTKVMTNVGTTATSMIGGSYVSTTPLTAQTFTANWTGSKNSGNLVVAIGPVYTPPSNSGLLAFM